MSDESIVAMLDPDVRDVVLGISEDGLNEHQASIVIEDLRQKLLYGDTSDEDIYMLNKEDIFEICTDLIPGFQ